MMNHSVLPINKDLTIPGQTVKGIESSTTMTEKTVNGVKTATSLKIHEIYGIVSSTDHCLFGKQDSVLGLMEGLYQKISQDDQREIFVEQCLLIENYLQNYGDSTVPTELIIRLFFEEWKTITGDRDANIVHPINGIANSVILGISKAMNNTGKHLQLDSFGDLVSITSDNHIVELSNQSNKAYDISFLAQSTNIREEIYRILKENPEVTELHFPSSFPSKNKRILMEILSENRPLLGVLRIIPEGRVSTYVIRGIKYANDILSQQIVDEILNGIKENITIALNQYFGQGNVIRITSSHNKITVAVPKECHNELLSQKELDEIVRSTIVEKKSILDECAHRFQKTSEEIQKVTSTIRVSGGVSKVSERGDDLSKLEAVYESEIQARGGVFGIQSIERMQHIKLFEEKIATEFGDTRFPHGKYFYPVVILDIFGKPRPHPLLIDLIRKPGGKQMIEPERLGNQIESYLAALNQELDYIAPALDFESGFHEAHGINGDFRKGKITRESFETTYKNSLSKPAFFEKIDGKNGVCVMLDVKGMFSKNNTAFVKLSEMIADTRKTVTTLERLDALGNITRAFIRGTENIGKIYPNMLCSHGGDEFIFFIEGADSTNFSSILGHSKLALGNEGFDIRTSIRESKASKSVFEALDGETKIAKIIESLGRLPNGKIPTALRHIEVSTESLSPDYIVSELTRRKEAVERVLYFLDGEHFENNTLELRGLNVQFKKTGEESISIHAYPVVTTD